MSDTKKPGFFYRLFMRRSPRSGMMFGLAVMLFALGLLPHLLLPALSNTAAAVRGIALTLAIYLPGMLFCSIGLYGILKNVFKSKALNIILAIIGTLAVPLGGLLLLPSLLKSKRFLPALSAIGGAAVYSSSSFGLLDPFTAIFWGTILIIIALLGIEDEKPSLKWFALPLGVTVIMQFFVIYQEVDLQIMIREQREYLGRLTGRKVEISDFWERDALGFPPDSEPLKTMAAADPDIFFEKDKVTWKDVEKIEKEHPAFVKAFGEFLRLPISNITHAKPENGLFTGITLPEGYMFRRATDFPMMKIYASPADKKNVTSANSALITLREWTLKNPFDISLLVSRSIEARRLDALQPAIASGKYEKAEILELLGEPIEWNAALRAAYADSAIGFETIVNFMNNTLAGLCDPDTGKKFGLLPREIRVHFLKDYHFALQHYINICSPEESLSAMEKIKAVKFDDKEAKRNGFIISSMLLPAYEIMYIKTASIADRRQMVLLAVEVMEYYKQHGKLPGDLKFLPEIPLAEIDHLPFEFEKTEDGFRIYTRDDKGKKPKISAP
ncbi:MAG: hypothetical protein J6R86_05430, partial [Lentisphaeria bacterium]|nr:hypothetical protein [Lentisphaeria bacterium]